MGVGLVTMLLVGAAAGWIAGRLVKGRGFGLLGNMVVGILGAVVAGYLLPRLGLSVGGGPGAALVHATLGAVILLVVVRLLKIG